MLRTGLVSVTFRKLSVSEIISLVKQAGLEGIEWGGDVHVPHGDIQRARETRQQTLDAGLGVAAYGSYYRLGTGQIPFETVLESAVALGAPTIRVWAGTVGSRNADEACWQNVIRDGQEIAELAAGAGVTISFEFHPDTLTDTSQSALRLLEEINHPNVFSYWQVGINETPQQSADNLSALLPTLTNVHVFQWHPGYERLPLAEGQADWEKYLQILKPSPRRHFLMLEFVQNDTPESFLRDALTLKYWLA